MALIAASAFLFALVFANEAWKLEQDLRELDSMIDKLGSSSDERESD